MGTWTDLPITSDPAQRFAAVLARRSCEFTVIWSERAERWSFDLSIDGVAVLHGRRIVSGVDLLGQYSFGLGRLYAIDWEGKGADPGRTELPDGRIRLMHYDPAEAA